MPARLSVTSTGSGLGWNPVTSVTSSRTVTSGIRPPDCSMAPTRPDFTAWYGSEPNIVIFPLVGLRSASSMSREVDLPAPFGPSRAVVSPGRAVTRPVLAHRVRCLGRHCRRLLAVPQYHQLAPAAG